jgi:hypothetical protein
MIGFYSRDEKCLQRGTDWGFKQSCLRFVFKVSIKYFTLTQRGFLLHEGERPASTLDTLLTLVTHTTNVLLLSCCFKPLFKTARNPRSLQHPLLPKLRTKPGQSKVEQNSATQARN